MDYYNYDEMYDRINELRIGNILSWGTDYCIVTHLNRRSIKAELTKEKGVYVSTHRGFKNGIEPIILTSDILDKSGFVKKIFFRENLYSEEPSSGKDNDSAHFCYEIEGFDGNIVLEDHINNMERNIINNDDLGSHGWYVCVESRLGKVGIAMCHELHQLQNLYFSLTRQELKINL